MKNFSLIAVALLLLSAVSSAQQKKKLPVIDMHMHAIGINDQGPPPLKVGAPFKYFGPNDPKDDYGNTFITALKTGEWNESSITSPTTDKQLRDMSLAILQQRNIYAVCSGDMKRVREWKAKSPKRIINGVYWDYTLLKSQHLTVDILKRLFKSGEFKVFGEVAIQYDGISPADTSFEPYLKIAEEMDVPVGIHIGPGPPGVIFLGSAGYRARLHSPLILEEVLLKHPKLRIYAMHAGWPMLDDMMAMLYAYPQLYVDLAVIDYILPKKEFYRYLQTLVDAGFSKRIMYGSDQMVWPQAINKSIDNIEQAPFLSFEQKRDILFNNAARFLRLTDAQIRSMH